MIEQAEPGERLTGPSVWLRERRRMITLAAWALAPWSWFVVRDLHASFDIVALALPVVVFLALVVVLAVAGFRRDRAPLVGAVSLVVFGVVAIVGPWTPQGSGRPSGGVRVAAVNAFGHVPAERPIAADVLAQDADVNVISEMSDAMDDFVLPRYDHVLRSEPRGRWDIQDLAVVSRYPLAELALPESLRELGVRARVDAPQGSFVLYALHLPPPRLNPGEEQEVTTAEHQRIVRQVRDLVAAETEPVVLAGDLNLVDRAWGYRALTGLLDDAMRTGWVRPTALKPSVRVLLARVDHVLMPEGWCSAEARIFELRGSDHRGVAATVGPCA